MKRSIVIPQKIAKRLRAHLFQNRLEQGAFLFAHAVESDGAISMKVQDVYLVPPEGWRAQLEVYLEMTDEERAKIMKMARDGGYAVIDCHSHPGSDDDVEFSLSDRSGITDFAPYVQWKLSGRPFAALVWGEESQDGVMWNGDFHEAQRIDEVTISGRKKIVLYPRATWFEYRPVTWQGRSLDV
jgi:hypothetical protein